MAKAKLKQIEQGGATAGQAMVWDGALGAWSPASPGGAGSPFGEDYQMAQAEAATITTSTSPVSKITLTTPTLTGTYRVSFGIRIQHESAISKTSVNFNLDPGTIFCAIEPRDSANHYNFHGIREIVFSSESRTFEITHNTINASHDSTASEAWIEIFRVS